MQLAFVGVRLPEELKHQLEEDAKRSGWSVSEQIRFELLERRGQYRHHQPYLPTQPTSKGKDS